MTRQPIYWTDTSVTALVAPAPAGPLHKPLRLHAAAELSRAYGDVADSPLGRAVTDFFANGGRVSITVRAEDGHEGVAALEDADAFQLMTLDQSLAADGALAEAYALCERRHAFLVADADERGLPPAGLGPNAAVYHPGLLDAEGRHRPAAPAVAGVMARMDADRGVWRAPAGTTARIVGAADIAEHLGERQLIELNRRQVNGLRTMPDGSVVLWGARTTSADPEWKYVAVRRLFLFLEQTIHAGLSWVSFEPNGEPLWAEIRQDLSQLLARLWREGAFPGDRPSEAFFVRCDETTMSQDDLATGRVVCLVGIAPIAPSEFVTFTVSRATAAPDGTVRTPST